MMMAGVRPLACSRSEAIEADPLGRILVSFSRKHTAVLLLTLLMASCTQTPGPARMAGTCATLDGKVYLLGGLDSRGRILSSVVEYDPSTGAWASKASLPQPVALAAAAATESAIYLVGGRSGSAILADTDVYDQTVDSWSQMEPMTTARWSHMAAVVGQKLYVMGGIKGKGGSRRTLDSVEILDLETGTWTAGESLPGAVHSSAVAVSDGKIFVLGGRKGTGTSGSGSDRVFVFDPDEGAWSVVQPMAKARTGARAAAFQGKIYVVGGAVSDDALSSIEIYDPSSDSWSPAPPMSSPRTAHVVAVVGEELLIFGGASNSSPAAPGVLSEVETVQLGESG